MLLPTLRKTMGELVDPLKFDELETVPKDVIAKMAEMGAFGTTAPAEYGGGGMTHTMSARASEELGAPPGRPPAPPYNTKSKAVGSYPAFI